MPRFEKRLHKSSEIPGSRAILRAIFLAVVKAERTLQHALDPDDRSPIPYQVKKSGLSGSIYLTLPFSGFEARVSDHELPTRYSANHDIDIFLRREDGPPKPAEVAEVVRAAVAAHSGKVRDKLQEEAGAAEAARPLTEERRREIEAWRADMDARDRAQRAYRQFCRDAVQGASWLKGQALLGGPVLAEQAYRMSRESQR